MKLKGSTIKLELDNALKPKKNSWDKRASRKQTGGAQRTHAYCRDFKKEGLTKPRILIRIMLEELYDATRAECFSSVGFFDEWRPIDREV